MGHLLQTCRDHEYDLHTACIYLRTCSVRIDALNNPKSILHTATTDTELSLSDARAIYTTMSTESSPAQAYQVLSQSSALRTSLRIPPAIWHKLSKEIQAEIQAIRDTLQTTPAPSAKDSAKPNPQQLPKQYGLDRNATMASTDDDDRLTNCIKSYQADDEVTISDTDDDVRFGGLVVRAHVEWEERMIGFASSTMVSHAICDSGADSCVLGRMAKVIGITGRTANLVGYDPQTTKSGH